MVKRGLCRDSQRGLQHHPAVSLVVRPEELIDSKIPAALREVQGLAAGRTAARLPAGRACIDEAVDHNLPHVSDLVADVIRVMRLTGMRSAEVL